MFVEAFPPQRYPGLSERYAAHGLDVAQKLLPAYPYAVWRQCLQAQRELVFGTLTDDAAAKQQGERFIEMYFERTVMGRPLLLLLRALGPKRTLQRMTQNFRTGNNFSKAEVTMIETQALELRINDVFSPTTAWIEGLLGRGLTLAGMTVQFEAVSHQGDAGVFLARW